MVREGQVAAFVSQGQLADILDPGTHTLNTNNLPVLSTLKAIPFLFTSPIIADVYFISTRQFVENKWATKGPVIKRDSEFDMVRVRSFGKFAFRVTNPMAFMSEFFGSKNLVLTYDIIAYLSSMITESFAVTVADAKLPVLDIATDLRKISDLVLKHANERAEVFGVEITQVIVESVSLPDEVERLIDEQSGIGMAKRDMETFSQYQSIRAMRDAAQQKGGLAGLGAGLGLGNMMAKNLAPQPEAPAPPAPAAPAAPVENKYEKLKELKALMDDGILTEAEFTAEKQKILNA